MALLAVVMASGIASCNKKDDEPDEAESVIYLPNVAVTAFNLKANTKVMNKLDSVFFTIDVEHGVIFNADSLPVGAQVNKLVTNISYSSFVTSAKIIMEGGTTRNDTVDYMKNPGDSIDFTGNVHLVVATANDELKKTYTIKVNVHRQQPDSLAWGETAMATLPSRLANPVNQKTVNFKGNALALIEESDGSMTLSVSDDLYSNSWQKKAVTLPFAPDIRSMAAASDALYILDRTGALYTSIDGSAWTPTGEVWNKIIGGYSDSAIGLKTASDGLRYAQYPVKDIDAKIVDTDFPLDGFSNFEVYSNKWTTAPVGFFCGGEKADGTLSDAVWAFDGRNWITLASGGFPALKGASLVPYYSFRTTSGMIPTEFEAWMLIGGEKSDGSFNRKTYISYDNAVNWRMGSTLLQLPDAIPAMTGCDNIVRMTSKDTNLSDAWKVMSNGPAKVKWTVDGDMLQWDCPYIYLIGGYRNNGALYNTIWRGALNRLTSAPII